MDKVAELEAKQFKFSLKCMAIFWLGILSGFMLDNDKLIVWFDSFVKVNQENVVLIQDGMLSNTELLRKLRLYGVTLTNIDCTGGTCKLELPLPSSRRSQESIIHIIKSVFTEHFNNPVELNVMTESDVLMVDIKPVAGSQL